MIDDQTIHLLNSLSLADVMRNNEFPVDHQTSRMIFYRCPFHTETSGSFAVEKFPKKGETYAGFNCFVCGETAHSQGRGAIMLQQKLLENAHEKSDFPSVVNRLAKDFNLIIEGDYKNGYFHRRTLVAPQDTISFQVKEGAFSNAELRALGCQVLPVFRKDRGEDGELAEYAVHDERGEAIYKYSFGEGFYQSSCQGNNFDSRLLRERFNLYALESYTTPAKADKDGVLNSSRISSTDSYPIFLFRYEDEQGWWARKYEPYFREVTDKNGKSTGNYKFTYWYQDGKRRTDLANQIYGDVDVMKALKTGTIESSDEEGHPTVMVERKENKRKLSKKVFDRIIICSGPRDAINVYFHSNAHVVYPHSESVDIADTIIRKLFDLARSVYVLYDIDKTGIEQMHRLALRYLDMKVIYLPEDLKKQYNPRSRKPCKDAEEFFNFYPNVMRNDKMQFRDNVNERFAGLVNTAKRMRFWDAIKKSTKDEDGSSYTVIKYTLNFETMSQFLSANGFYRYEDESGANKFVYVNNNIVDIVDEGKSLATARSIMKRFLEYNSRHYNEDLANAISTQKRVGRDSMADLKETKLNFVSWGKDYDHFFFKNCAVRVTKDSIQTVDYKDLGFNVNRLAIMDVDYHPSQAGLFEIVENPEYAIEKQHHEERLADKRMTEDEINKEMATFTAYERMWRFKLRFNADMDKLPPCLQFLYDTSRIHWKKEALGMALTAEEKQRQDMHFVCKVAAMGYALSRYRTGAMQQMSVFTDYSVVDEGKSSGGTGKSIVRDLFSLVRKVCLIPGKGFKKKENMSRNFQEFRDTIDSICFIDDLREDIAGDEFYNITQNITVKTLYNNEVTLPQERTPKLFVTTNKMSFDLNEPSTQRRIFPGMMSDYYHPADYSGKIREVSPYTKFKKDIILEATEEERNQSVYMMLQCCQFYLGLQESLIPPMEKDGMMRIIYSSIKDALFIEWANKFFGNSWHFCRPLSVQEIIMSYLDHKGDEITTITVKKNKDDVMKKLRLYCQNMQYNMNPEIVYRADKGSAYPRHYAWETLFVNDRPRKGPRERKHTRVCFFYRIGDEPRTLKEILPCPDTDEERAEEERREKEV